MVDCKKIKFSGHALHRMFERIIKKSDILSVISAGEVIVEYPEDTPYPSLLLCGFIDQTPLHIVVAFDQSTGTCYIVTTYIPTPDQWTDGYKTRR